MSAKHRILVVDDHPVFREGLVRVLSQEKDLQVVGEFASAAEAIKAMSTLKPELAILDISLEDSNGLDLASTLRKQVPHILILILSMHKESVHAEKALRTGANGYIMKRESGPQLLGAIRQVLSGRIYLSEPTRELLLRKISAAPGPDSQSPDDLLSDREFEVFQLIGKGYGTRQIADELHISMKTVESHREHIRDKMHIPSTFELVRRAIHWMHAEKETL